MFKSATFKLTVSYLTVLMLISLVFSAVVFRVGSDNLAFGLARETQELSTAFPIFNGTQYAQPNPADLAAGKRHLLDELVLTNVLVLIGGGLISYVLARETLKPIERAHEQQKRFTADVSHELRTPLTALRMESEVALMDKKLKASGLRDVITSNMEEASKLETLINNLMKLSRLEAGELQRQFNELDLKNIAAEAIDQIKAQADKKNIKVTLKGADRKVKGDNNALVQMVVIFLDNAIKYSPQDTTIDVSIAKNSTQPEISIKDRGQGIAPKDLEHVFDRFFRADMARSGNAGFGLGLSIAKLIADVHKADITITSAKGQGTTVKVSFIE